MSRPRPPRKVVVDPTAGDDVPINGKNCPQDSKPSPGYPMFPREKFPWMKAKYEPKYVRVHKIVLGQELLAEWPSGPFRGNPESTTLELLAELWGKGVYKVELMSAATDDHGIYRIFQNTIEVEEGDDDLPFPGPDRSAKVLAEDGEEGDDDDDDDGNGGGPSFFTGGRSSGGHMRPGMQQPGMPGMPPHPGMQQPGMPGMPGMQQPGMPPSGMRHGMHGGYPPYGYPPYAYGGYPPPQPESKTSAADIAAIIAAVAPIVTGIVAAVTVSAEKRETQAAVTAAATAAAQREAAAQQQTFLIAMLGRNEQQTEKVLTLANAKPAVDPVMIETMANIKAELAHIRAEKSRGGGNPNEMEAIDKYLALFDKIGDRVASRGGGGEEDTVDKILGNLPLILTAIQAARGGQVPALPQQAAPQQSAPDPGSAAGYPAQGYPSQ